MSTLLCSLQYYESYKYFELYVTNEDLVLLYELHSYSKDIFIKNLISLDLLHSTKFTINTYNNICVVDVIISYE